MSWTPCTIRQTAYLDEVHDLRERYAADLVHLIIEGFQAPACGQAIIPFKQPYDDPASFGFGYTQVRLRAAHVRP